MNPRTVSAGDMPRDNLAEAKVPINAEEGQNRTREVDVSQSNMRNTPPSASMNMITESNRTTEDKDEITASPVQEQVGKDIRFEDLPHPRKYERKNDECIVP